MLSNKRKGIAKRVTAFILCLVVALPCFAGMADVLEKAVIYAAENANLVIHYTFDDKNDLGHDSSGKGNNGVIHGKVSAADGVRGGGVFFDSSNYTDTDAYISMPTDAFKMRQFTYSAFVKYDIETVGQYARLLAVETASKNNQYQVMARPGTTATSYKVELFGGNPQNAVLETEGLIDRPIFESWHHVTVTYDGSEMKLYINGSFIYSVKTTADPSRWNIIHAYLGRTAIWKNPSYHGYMDDVRIYNKALTEDEIGKRIALSPSEMGSYVKLLSDLKINGKTIDAFDGFTDTFFYTIKEGDAYPTVTAQAPFDGTSIEITQASGDTNYAEIKVNYGDGSKKTVRVYFVTRLDGVYHPELADVNINDAFWNDKIKLYLEKTAPYVLNQWVNNTHSGLSNFDKVARGDRNTGNYVGSMTWGESDFYAAMAGASLFLQKYENKALENQISSYIDHIYAASESEPSGYFSVYNLLMTNGAVFGEGINAAVSMDLFCLGYLIEFGINWYEATGDARMLRVALRFVNFTVDYSNGGSVNFISFHTGVEYNLIALYEFIKENPEVKNESLLKNIPIDEDAYLALARSLITHRGDHTDRKNGSNYGTYGNDHFTYDEIRIATGHIVEAMLYYYALSEMGKVSGDDSFTDSAYRLWDNTVNKQMYITGGSGSLYETEAFGGSFHLPNMSYTESCTSCALLQYSDSLSMMFRESKFQDIVEHQMYNNILGSVGANGTSFFYTNPLYSLEDSRYTWHAVPCCTKYALLIYGNLPRNIYAYRGNDIYADQYIGSTATIRLDSGNVILSQQSSWAWEGTSTITITDGAENIDRLLLRIPEWSNVTDIYVNGKKVSYTLEKGYAVIDRNFADGDAIRIKADMSVQREYSDPRVKTNESKVALRRGVFIYCLEEADNKHTSIDNAPLYACLDSDAVITVSENRTLYGGVKTLKAAGKLYTSGSECIDFGLTFVPFYARSNRGAGAINVWIAEKASAIEGISPTIPKEHPELKSKGVVYKGITNADNPNGSGGSYDVSVMVDGKKGLSDSKAQYDGFGSVLKDTEGMNGRIWYGVEFDKKCDVSYVVFYEGGHWGNGGWFGASPTVQAKINGIWVDVRSTISRDYPGDCYTYQLPALSVYSFELAESVECTAIRVIGKKNSFAGHASCSEIEVYGQISNGTSKTTAVYGTPTEIDGDLDDGWKDAPSYSANKIVGSPQNSMKWKIMYDDTYLYFYAEVTDPTVGTAEQEKTYDDSYWMRNTVQIYLDLGYERTAVGSDGSYGKDENDIRFDINARGYFFCHWIRGDEFIDYKSVITDTGYIVECRLDLGVYPEFENREGKLIGFDIWACDSTDYKNRAGFVSWTGNERAYMDSSVMGTVILGKKTEETEGYNGIIKGGYLPSLGASLTPIANARGEHMNNIGCITDGYKNDSVDVDTWSCTYTDDLGVWFGVEFEKEYDVTQVVFWEGRHWPNGGWFGASPKLQCFVEGEWIDVGFELSPQYPGDSQAAHGWGFEPYFFTLEKAVTCSKIRVMGVIPSCDDSHTSISEIEVFGYAAGQAPPKEPVFGDIDGDGIVANDDITLIVRYLSGFYEDICNSFMDVNSDGKINNRDAVEVILVVAFNYSN